MTKGFKREGYQVESVLDGQQALPLILSGNFDLIVLDLGLPGLDGRLILKEIRAQGLQTPIIVVTALSIEHEEQLSLGANDYISKPFRFSKLLSIVRSYL